MGVMLHIIFIAILHFSSIFEIEKDIAASEVSMIEYVAVKCL